MASFRCYDSSDVIATLIMTNFPLYLIQLWWQFFPNACLWRRSLCSNLAGIDSEKLYRATFICQYGLFCCMALVSFRLFCKNLGNLQQFFGQMDYRPPGKKLSARLCLICPIKRRQVGSVLHYMTFDVMMVIYCCSFEPPKNMADGTVVSDGLNADRCSDKKVSRDRVDFVREEYKRYKRKDMKAERRKANQCQIKEMSLMTLVH